MPKLKNPRHERFAQEVAQGKRLLTAYESAGFHPDTGNAVRLHNLPSVRERIDEILTGAAELAGVAAAEVMRELARIGFSDVRRAIDWQTVPVDGKSSSTGEGNADTRPLLATHIWLRDEIDHDTAAAIAQVKPGPYGPTIKFHDKRGALVDLGKQLGMFRKTEEKKPVVVNVMRFLDEDPDDETDPDEETDAS